MYKTVHTYIKVDNFSILNNAFFIFKIIIILFFSILPLYEKLRKNSSGGLVVSASRSPLPGSNLGLPGGGVTPEEEDDLLEHSAH